MVFSSLFSGGCFSAFAIHRGVPLSEVLYAIGAIFLVLLAMSVPALLILLIAKGGSHIMERVRGKND